ncbi:DUF2577 domain-containing protein [Solibaculum mannosilyticum]|uniref:DUF2577 domain-containing protein n=1 Tax=Solibaculum mannosilyticum TaxID=2780922 RepID=A0A7I8D1G8_9FIRM|nr:DUF2577 domain-containing protein [Solibaculum mannosilyticum]BCI60647.1 hypothetical protein C12CBH8_12860 [Solibaculum mannosilyticum]CZT56716.1 hypothetical protein BN3661_01531 [Eubacteriaceae bacterium CHKCI005]
MPNMVDLMKTAAMEAMEQSKPVSIHFGTVLNASPLQVNVEQRLTLDEPFLVLTETSKQLSTGDKIILLRMQGGQRYIVLDKEAT